ncbi:16819_t:CDS:2 [Dentiscutata erythropus]|uniref:16819_t:CDS:1 n=1 Tax=Dentiscutata erythropus TaxID=1348616 RepID=A0A9N9FXD0_9GLOM|nr:16819_t:CDS:2 [Dentiscutata erythropus]
MGGVINSQLDSNFFYFDFSLPFDVLSPSKNLTSIPVNNAWGTASVGGIHISEIFLFGGIMTNKNNNSLSKNLVYCYDTFNHTWTAPEISGTQPLGRREATSTFNPNNGWIFIFGGAPVQPSNRTLFFNDFIILDSVELSWVNFDPPPNGPTRRASHTATLNTNGYIVIIGGTEMTDNLTLRDVDINQIWLYDMNSGKWMNQTAGGDNVGARGGHTAVLDSNGNIIVYGGSNVNNIRSTPDLIILNVATYKWSAPSISSENAPPPLTYHTAAIFKDYMIISNGNITNDFSGPLSSNSKMFLFDINSQKWVESYIPHSDSIIIEIIQITGFVVHAVVVMGLAIVYLFNCIGSKNKKKRDSTKEL